MTARRTRWSGPVGALLLVVAALVAIQACGLYGPAEPEPTEVVAEARPVAPIETVAPPPTEPARSPAPEPSPSTAPEPRDAPGPGPNEQDRTVEDALRRLQTDAEPPVPTEREEQPPPPLEPGGDLSARPVFTPFTVAPVMRNRNEVAAALEREYPALLRDAGVGGRAIVWVRLDTNGVVQDAQINQSSGQPALDQAALRVARAMEFSPALNRDQIVPVWVSIPIQFQSR